MVENTSSFKVYNASAGSGKTFTLVKEYLNIVLKSPSDYVFQNILAITFTNKAAAEMKERILLNLRAFSDGVSNDMFDMIAKENRMDTLQLQNKAKRVLDNLMQNYSAFNITTIDSFTHKLIRTFAYDLGLPLNFDVEMDGAKLISEAVDVLISKIGYNKELTEVLVSFSLGKVEEDKAWDITKDLNSVASILLNEDDIHQLKNIGLKNVEDFKRVEKKLKIKKNEIEILFEKNGRDGLALIESQGLDYKSFIYSELPKHFEKFTTLSKLKYDAIKFDGRLQKNITNGVLYSKSGKDSEAKSCIDSIADDLVRFYEEGKIIFEKYHGSYVLIKMVLKNMIPMAVLNYIQKELNDIKEQNSICLSAEFNTLISDKIKNEPAPFIYERIGEKFKYYFIDEMQDTSSLQWKNLVPLINNALSQEDGRLLLVGDAKQAIYRWRGGKAEQFIDLSIDGRSNDNNPFNIGKKLEYLGVNYRSYSEVVEFNNSFFTHAATFLNNQTYHNLYKIGNSQELNKNIGGYVQLDFVTKSDLSPDEKDLAYPRKVLEIIQGLDSQFEKKDICVIVRKKKDGILIANHLTENNIPIISSETLLLQNSLKVQFIIHILTYIQNPLDLNAKFKALHFLKKSIDVIESDHSYYDKLLPLEPEGFFKELEGCQMFFDFQKYLQMPFYEGIEYIVRSFELLETTDAYVQFFLDVVLDFQRKNHHDLSLFLNEWSQKKEVLSIAATEGENAVRIMTIHKSKGLEFPVVIFPADVDITNEIEPSIWYDGLEESVFGDMKTSRISCSSQINFTGNRGEHLFNERKSELALDNLNLLYVALTRAVEQLYIVTEDNLDKSGNEKVQFFSGMFVNYLKTIEIEKQWKLGKLSYAFGDKKRVLTLKNEQEKEAVRFQEKFISSSWENHEIKIVSNSSLSWGDDENSAVSYGLLVHEMLSKIIYEQDLIPVFDSYLSAGLIQTKDEILIKEKLEKVVYHNQLNKYFNKEYTVITEREIIDEHKNVLIPDRLMISDKSVVIIDFKTGKKSNKYKEQLTTYGDVLLKMGYHVKAKIILYINNTVDIVFV